MGPSDPLMSTPTPLDAPAPDSREPLTISVIGVSLGALFGFLVLLLGWPDTLFVASMAGLGALIEATTRFVQRDGGAFRRRLAKMIDPDGRIEENRIF